LSLPTDEGLSGIVDPAASPSSDSAGSFLSPDRASPRVRFGVNYTPSVGWFYHWLDFNLDDTRADLDSIADLGLDHIRLFPLWPLFQPNRTLIRPRAVDQLLSMVDAAAERGLDVSVDGLQGHLSSFDFVPSWLRTWHRRNMFTDPVAIAAQAEYLRTLAAALADRPNFIAMTLGNEVNQFSDAPHPDRDEADPDSAQHWILRLLEACDQGAPGKPHTHSEYDAVWFQDGHGFTPAHASRLGAATTVHSWVFNGTAQRHGADGAATRHLAEYLIELSKAWAIDPGRPVWLQEVGAPAPHVPAERAADFAEATVLNALSCENLTAITWWCSHDVDRGLADFPELEYSLGLLTNARKPKPIGNRVAELAARWAGQRPPAVRRTTALVVDAGDEITAPTRATCAPGGAFYEAWVRLATDGVRATAVLAQQVENPRHLAARGITEVIHPAEVRSS
jgi:hypothetical protein